MLMTRRTAAARGGTVIPALTQCPRLPFSSLSYTAARWAQLYSANSGEAEAEGEVFCRRPHSTVWLDGDLTLIPRPCILPAREGQGVGAGSWGSSGSPMTSIFLA